MAIISLRQLLDHAAEHSYGVRKVNIDTDCRMAITGQFRKIAREKPQEFDPRKFLTPSWDAMRELCRNRFEQFNTAGQATKIDIIPLSVMAERYQAGDLEPTTNLRRDTAA